MALFYPKSCIECRDNTIVYIIAYQHYTNQGKSITLHPLVLLDHSPVYSDYIFILCVLYMFWLYI